jgi:hypothetical protein
VISGDVDAELRQMADSDDFPHREAARHAIRFRAGGDVAALVAVYDDAHPCGMTEIILAMAGAERPWLNWVPMPTEAICNVADEVGRRRAKGEELRITRLALTAAEPPSAEMAARRVIGECDIELAAFPEPDIRMAVRPGRYAIWRYDGTVPRPARPAPSAAAVEALHEVAAEPWASPISGHLQAGPLGRLPLDDLLGLLAQPPGPPPTDRWQYLATDTPTYWYRLLQPWVCLGLLHHAEDEPWLVSTRREVLIDLAFGIEDWISDAALFALVTAAFRDPEIRDEVRRLVRARLDAAMAAPRLVTIEESVARLMLLAPGCQPDDAAAAAAAIVHATPEVADEPAPAKKRRWWRHHD